MTREEQDEEIGRGNTFTSGEKAVFQRNKVHLMENRPLLLPNNVPLSTPAAHEARRSSARQNSNALEELTQREVARTSDPIIQQNARTIAGLGTAPVSLASTQDERSEFIERRQEKRGRVPVRSIGQNATSVGQQADRKAMDALYLSQRAVAKAEDTLYYPNLLPGQAIKTQVLITYNEVEDSNENGGVVVGRKLEKPSVTVIARSKEVAYKVLGALASCVVADENSTMDSLQYNYNLVVMPDGGASLHGTVDAGIQQWDNARARPTGPTSMSDITTTLLNMNVNNPAMHRMSPGKRHRNSQIHPMP